jgi:hypothetical protein
VSPAYAELVALAERELELVQAERFEGLDAIQARRAELVSILPPSPPAEALPFLQQAAAMQARTEAVLEQGLTHAAAELQAVRRGRHAVQAYTPGSGAESRLVDSTG